MHVKEAIERARGFLSAVFDGEPIGQVRLEEVVFDERAPAWKITFGLTRPSVPTTPGTLGTMMGGKIMKTEYKVVTIPDNPHGIPSITIREVSE